MLANVPMHELQNLLCNIILLGTSLYNNKSFSTKNVFMKFHFWGIYLKTVELHPFYNYILEFSSLWSWYSQGYYPGWDFDLRSQVFKKANLDERMLGMRWLHQREYSRKSVFPGFFLVSMPLDLDTHVQDLFLLLCIFILDTVIHYNATLFAPRFRIIPLHSTLSSEEQSLVFR